MATINIPTQNRSGTDTFGPVIIPAGVDDVVTVANIPTAHYENPAHSFTVAIELSVDGNPPWVLYCAYGWRSPGGPYVDPKTGVLNPPPRLICNGLGAHTGERLRATVNVPDPMQIGWTITV